MDRSLGRHRDHIDTVGSSYDTVLAAYTGNAVGSLTERASNDDTLGLRSEITFSTGGTVYIWKKAGS